MAVGIAVLALGCGADERQTAAEPPLDLDCAARGEPISLGELLGIFREHRVTLDVVRPNCANPQSTGPDATNAGTSGVDREDDVWRNEGAVECYVGAPDAGPEVVVVKRPTDETEATVLNVRCTVYPSEPTRETVQVGRVESALDELASAAAER